MRNKPTHCLDGELFCEISRKDFLSIPTVSASAQILVISNENNEFFDIITCFWFEKTTRALIIFNVFSPVLRTLKGHARYKLPYTSFNKTMSFISGFSKFRVEFHKKYYYTYF